MDFYLDNSLASSGQGTSWGSAWKSFSDINWGAMRPGDTLYLSGGATGQTYTGQLTVGASGAAGAPITITAGIDPGHNGKVILDEFYRNTFGVQDSGHNYVTVSDLNVQNTAGAGFGVRNVTAGVVIDSNSVDSGNPGGDQDARGFDVRSSVGQNAVVVENNSFTTPAVAQAQTDGIYSMFNDGVVYQGNSIKILNSVVADHSDGIQSDQDINITIKGNDVEQLNGASNNHGMWVTNIASGGSVAIQNNTVEMPSGAAYAIGVDDIQSGYTGGAQIIDNTVDGGLYSYGIWNSPKTTLVGNVAEPLKSGTVGVAIFGTPPPAGNIKGNDIWPLGGAAVADVNGRILTWTEWQSSYDPSGSNTDPGLLAPAATASATPTTETQAPVSQAPATTTPATQAPAQTSATPTPETQAPVNPVTASQPPETPVPTTQAPVNPVTASQPPETTAPVSPNISPAAPASTIATSFYPFTISKLFNEFLLFIARQTRSGPAG